MSLLALQRDFRNWLVDAPNDMALRHGARGGLDVYHNAYRVQLADCLRETFVRLFLWLGEEQFLAAARAHIERHTPTSWTLGDYGEGFDKTLAALYPDDLEVAELAWLDWALCRAFDGADAPSLPASALDGIDWDKAVIRFVPTLRLCHAGTNAGAIWSALSAGAEPPAAAALPAPGGFLVWRQDMTPCFRTIEEEERHMLDMALAGASFGAVCESAVERIGPDEGVAKAGAIFGQWLQDKLVRDITG